MKSFLILLLLVTSSATGARAQPTDSRVLVCALADDPAWCEVQKVQFLEMWPQAVAGDYQAQRNVAHCLSTGCDGAVAVDVVAGCAWRMVIMASDAPTGASDVAGYRNACARLTERLRKDARAMAETSFFRVFGRKMGRLG